MSPFSSFSSRYSAPQVIVSSGSRRVIKVHDRLLEQDVVLKGVLSSDPSEIASVLEEYRALQALEHPALVRPLAWENLSSLPDSSDGPFFGFVQPFLEGQSLLSLRGKLTALDLRQWALETLELVAWLHHRGLTHLDLKPAHCVRATIRWRLVDLDQMASDDPFRQGLHGTLPYLALEVLKGESGGPAADLFSVGAMLWEAVSGSPPVLHGHSRGELLHFLANRPLPALERISHEPDLVRLCHALLAPSPADRPASAEAALAMLEGATPQRWRRIPPSPAHQGVQRMLEAFDTAAEHLSASSCGALTLVGPPRSGRSALLASVVEHLQVGGARALLLQPVEERMSHPLLEQICRWLELLSSEVAPPSTAEGPAGATPAEALELRENATLSRLMRAAERAGANQAEPVWVLIDDPDCWDALSKRLLERLFPLLPESGLALVLAGQGCETASTSSERIDLTPLSPLEVRALTEATLGVGYLASESDLTALLQASSAWAGRVRDALVRRWRYPDETAWTTERSDLNQIDIGALSLPQGVLTAAKALAVSSIDLDAEMVEVLLEESGATGSFEAMVASGLLISGGAPTLERWRFTSETLRLALLSGPGEPRFHLRLAEVLEQRAALDPALVSAEAIVRHFLASNEQRRALSHLGRAVAEAVAGLRLTDACAHLDIWLSLLRPGDPGRAEVLRRRGGLLLELGQPIKAQQTYEEALRQPGLRDNTVKGRCLAGLGRALYKQVRFDEAVVPLEDALTLTSGLPASERIPWWHWLAWCRFKVGGREGVPAMEACLERARQEGIPTDSRLEVDQLHLELTAGAETDRTVEALIDQADRGLEKARRLSYPSGEVRLLNLLAQLLAMSGQSDRQLEVARLLFERASTLFNLLEMLRSSHNVGMVLKGQGKFTEALEQFQRAARLAGRMARPELEIEFLHEVVDLLVQAGSLERAERELKRTQELLGSQSVPSMLARQQDLLELRVAVCREVGALEVSAREQSDDTEQASRLKALDDRLAQLIESLTEVKPEYLLLEAVGDRMSLMIARGRWREALKVLAPHLAREERAETAAIWRRLHALGRQAHGALAGTEERDVTEKTESTAPPEVEASAKPAPSPVEALVPAESQPPAEPAHGGNTRAKPPDASSGALWIRASSASSLPLEAPDEWLDRVVRILDASQSEEALVVRLAEVAGALVGGRGLVVLLGEEGQVLREAGTGGCSLKNNNVSQKLVSMVKETGASFRSGDVQQDSRLLEVTESIRRMYKPSVLCEPIHGDKGRLVGVLYVDELDAGRALLPEVVRTAERVTAVAGTLLLSLARRRLPDDQDDGAATFGSSRVMQKLKRELHRYASSRQDDLVVFLHGERGVGKTLFGAWIHEQSSWKSKPYQNVNCAAIPAELFEPTMFGSLRGAFTGALKDTDGHFKLVGDGTLFLDEIGELSLPHQAKLLEVLEQRTFNRVGEGRKTPFRAHLILATNQDLEQLQRAGKYRSDLLDRMKVNEVRIPSLRERDPSDIRRLISRFLHGTLVAEKGWPKQGPRPRLEDHFTPDAQHFLLTHDWPGNVRQLSNLFRKERIRERLRQGKKVDPALLGELLSSAAEPLKSEEASSSRPAENAVALPLEISFEELARRHDAQMGEHVSRVVQSCGGDKNKAAGVLGCSRDTVYKYLKKLK